MTDATSKTRGDAKRRAGHSRRAARRWPRAPDGRRRQADAHDRRPHHSRPRDRAPAPQCDGLILNANGDPARFAAFGLPVIADGVADFPGPLAGILAALDWAAANRPDVKLVLSAAADCPFLPRDLVSRLHGALEAENAELAVAASDGQSHPVIGLWSVALARAAAPRACRRGHQEDRPLDRALQACHRDMADDTARSVLQRQHHGRYRGSRAAGGAGRRLAPRHYAASGAVQAS